MNKIRQWLIGKEAMAALQQKAITPGVRYEVRDGKIITPIDRKQEFIDKAYCINDIVYAIVNIILDKVRLPEWGLYKVVDESSLKSYNSIMKQGFNITVKDYKRALKFKDQALEPIKSGGLQTGKLAELLKYPNEDEDMSEHVANCAGFKLITGDAFEAGDLLTAGANQGIPNSIEILPSQFMLINVSNDFPAKAVSYQLQTWNQNFTAESVLHEKYWNPNWNINGAQLYGMSPLKAAAMNTLRNNSAKQASYSKFQNNGMEVIIFPDDIRFSPEQGVEQAAAVKNTINSPEYTGPRSFGKIAASGIKMGSIPLGLSPVELGIIESEKWDAVMFCAIFGVPPELMGLVQKTYNNVVEAEKALTTRSAIPLLTSRRNAYNRKIMRDWGFKGQNIYIDYSLECFPELEANRTDIVNYTSKMIAISPNEERELVGLESDPDPIMDEKWVLNGIGRVPISDFQQNQVDAHLNAGAANDQQGNQAGGL